MAAVAHNPSFAKKAGVPQSVGKDFAAADQKAKSGARNRAEQQAINKPKTNHGDSALFSKGGYMAKKIPPFMGKESKSEEAKEMKIKAKSPAMYMKGEKAEGVHGASGKEKPTKYAKGGFVRSADGIAQKGKTRAKMCWEPNMKASRGMGDINPSKMPGGKKQSRRDDTGFTQYAEGGPVGLYANIHAKRARGDKMRKPGQKGAPTAQAFVDSAKTARKM